MRYKKHFLRLSLCDLTNQNMGMRIGAAKGEFTVPEDIDGCNGEIETLFGGGE